MRLFKYVNASRTDILKNQCIRFSQQYALNDPFESLPFYTDHTGKFLDYSWSIETGRTELKPDKDLLTWFINHHFVSLSLTTQNDNLLMWAHYAANHSGFVIEFDGNHPFFTATNRCLYQVPYSQDRPEITLTECEKLVLEISGKLKKSAIPDKKHLNELIQLFRKSHHWSYEEEWRLLSVPELASNYDEKEHGFHMHISDDRPIHEGFSSDYCALYPLPADCIKSIFCGAKITTGTARYLFFTIKNNPQYQHIALKLAEIDHTEFKLNFKDLKQEDILKAGELMYEWDIENGKRKRLDPKWYHMSYTAAYEREKRKTILNH
jgi:hypothetical protein